VTAVARQGVSRSDVVDLLASSVGATKAEHAVRAASGALRLDTSSFSLEQAMALLEKIAEEPGILGITARFAKSRALLRWTP
jgi:hypothetical protein